MSISKCSLPSLLATAFLLRGAVAAVDCTSSPNCTTLRREDCNPEGTVPNACGDCLNETFGDPGPTNSYCLSGNSCGAVYPGMSTCPLVDSTGLYSEEQLPFVLPFGQCVCDDGTGRRWPTAPGACAKVALSSSTSGQYDLLQCTSSACKTSTCEVLASWSVVLSDVALESLSDSFTCRTFGSDAALLVDQCWNVVGTTASSAFCGHAALVDNSPEYPSREYQLNCTIAPLCPESVLADNLDETCCLGNSGSFEILADGTLGDVAAGFCSKAATHTNLTDQPLQIDIVSGQGFADRDEVLQGGSDLYCVSVLGGRSETRLQTAVFDDATEATFDASITIGSWTDGEAIEFSCWDRDYGDADDLLGRFTMPSSEFVQNGYDGTLKLANTSGADATLSVKVSSASLATTTTQCAALTVASSWKGCACLNDELTRTSDRTCTTDCTLTECGVDNALVPETPEAWRTSEVSSSLTVDTRSSRVATGSANKRQDPPKPDHWFPWLVHRVFWASCFIWVICTM